MTEPTEQSETHSRRIGKGMMMAAWVIGIGLLTSLFGIWEKKQINPNQSPTTQIDAAGVRTVTLERNRMQHYVATGSINRQPVEFLLDTGATDVVIPEQLAERLKLPKGPQGYAMTANGRVKTYATVIRHLQIGSIELTNVRASVNPNMGDLGILLGMSALKQVEFSQRGGQLTLRQYPNR